MDVKTLRARDKPGQLKLDLFVSYLALTRGPASREELLSLFWPSNASEGKTSALRQTVASIKKTYGDNAFTVSDAKRLELNLGVVSVDAVRFRDLIDASSFSEALALYHADFFAGLSASDFSADPRLDGWLDDTREALRNLAAYAELELAKKTFRQGSVPEAAQLAWQSYTRVEGLIDLGGAPEPAQAFRTRFELYYNLIRADPAAFTPLVAMSLSQDAEMFDADDRPTLAQSPVEALAILKATHGLEPNLNSTEQAAVLPGSSSPVALSPEKKGRSASKRTQWFWGVAAVSLLLLVAALFLPRLNSNVKGDTLYVDNFEGSLDGFSAEYPASWQFVTRGNGGKALCGTNKSGVPYSYLIGREPFTGDLSATFDIFFADFPVNQEGMLTLNLTGTNDTYYGLFFAGGVLELTKINNGSAEMTSTVSTNRAVVRPNEWHTFRLVRDGSTLAVYRAQETKPLLSRTEPDPLPEGVLALAVGEYALSKQPKMTMCIDNLRVSHF